METLLPPLNDTEPVTSPVKVIVLAVSRVDAVEAFPEISPVTVKSPYTVVVASNAIYLPLRL